MLGYRPHIHPGVNLVTEQDWMIGTDPTPMREFVRRKANDRNSQHAAFFGGRIRLVSTLVEIEVAT